MENPRAENDQLPTGPLTGPNDGNVNDGMADSSHFHNDPTLVNGHDRNDRDNGRQDGNNNNNNNNDDDDDNDDDGNDHHDHGTGVEWGNFRPPTNDSTDGADIHHDDRAEAEDSQNGMGQAETTANEAPQEPDWDAIVQEGPDHVRRSVSVFLDARSQWYRADERFLETLQQSQAALERSIKDMFESLSDMYMDQRETMDNLENGIADLMVRNHQHRIELQNQVQHAANMMQSMFSGLQQRILQPTQGQDHTVGPAVNESVNGGDHVGNNDHQSSQQSQ